MRSNEIFASMSPEESLAFLQEIREEAPRVSRIALTAAAEAFKLRPQFLQRQPLQRQADWVRRALGRKMMIAVAEETLAEYFLEYHKDLLIEWLDVVGLEHEEGILQGDAFESPEKDEMQNMVTEFRAGEHPQRRDLLLKAFAAQTSIEWPELEALL